MIRAPGRDLYPDMGLRLSAGALLLLSLGCGRARGPKVDSESHFLGQCAVSCADGLSCICGVCTVACAAQVDCTGASGAQCRELDTAECGSAEPAACDVACASDANCAEVPGASCAGGWCRGPDASGALGAGSSEEVSASPGTNELNAELPIATPLADCTSSVDRGLLVQADLARFEGCQTIYGDLDIPFSVDLRPLHALRSLMGNLYIHPKLGFQGSLEGLEKLELVSGDLELNSFMLPSFASLRQLRTVGTKPGKGLKISQGSGFADLSGLERLENLRTLEIVNAPDLVSIDALRLPSAIERLVLVAVPQLASADTLRSVREVENQLGLGSTGFVQLNMLAGLRRVGDLSLSGNALLTDASALAGLEALHSLFLAQNSLLTTFALPRVSELDDLSVAANLSLESLTGLDQLVSLPRLYVNDNPALAGLSLPRLSSLQDLDVWHNSRLATLELPLISEPLERVLVVSNAALASEALRPLLDGARQSKVGGNQGEPIGLDPCPWIRDGYCDAPPLDTLCAASTDASDCRDVGYEPPH